MKIEVNLLRNVGSEYKVREVYSCVTKMCSRRFKKEDVGKHVGSPEYIRVNRNDAYAPVSYTHLDVYKRQV